MVGKEVDWGSYMLTAWLQRFTLVPVCCRVGSGVLRADGGSRGPSGGTIPVPYLTAVVIVGAPVSVVHHQWASVLTH